MEFTKALVKKVRASSGGLPCVRGKEIFLESKNQVQVSTVITDYKQTSIKRLMDEIKKEIEPKNIKVTDTELIGLTTQDALTDYVTESLNVSGFKKEEQVLETKLLKLLGSWQTGANLFIDALSNTAPTPGGGSAGAISGAMGCALGQMALGVSLRSKKLPEENRSILLQLKDRLGEHRIELQRCISEDSESFDLFMLAMKLPKENPDRKAKMQSALKYAAEVPLRTAKLSSEALAGLRLCESKIIPGVKSDYKSAEYQLQAAIRCAAENVFINAESLEDKVYADKIIAEVKNYLSDCAM